MNFTKGLYKCDCSWENDRIRKQGERKAEGEGRSPTPSKLYCEQLMLFMSNFNKNLKH